VRWRYRWTDSGRNVGTRSTDRTTIIGVAVCDTHDGLQRLPDGNDTSLDTHSADASG
jgi:hypothetical protein